MGAAGWGEHRVGSHALASRETSHFYLQEEKKLSADEQTAQAFQKIYLGSGL